VHYRELHGDKHSPPSIPMNFCWFCPQPSPSQSPPIPAYISPHPMPFKKNLVFPPVYTHIHTHPFNGPFSGTTQVSWYQKGKTNLDFTETRDSEWQWHQLGHMQVCTSLQTDNHASTPPLSFYRPDALPAAQPTASKH